MAENDYIKYSDLVKPDSSITDLIAQLEKLMQTYSEALAKVRSEADALAKSMSNVSGATEQGRNATRNASAEADKLAKAEQQLAFAQSDTAKQIAELKRQQAESNQVAKLTAKLNASVEGSYNRLSAQYSLNKIALNKLSAEERKNNPEAKKLETETRKIYEEMKRLQEETGKFQLNVGNYTNSILQAIGINGNFGKSLIAIGKGGQEGKNALLAMKDSASAFLKTLTGFATNPVFLAFAGVAGAGVAFKWFYDYNKGIAEATRLTREFLGVQGKELESIRNEIQSIADTYGKDYLEVLQSVDVLTANFKISADEAMKIIEGGFQSGADLSGDMLSKIAQFAPTFHDAGIGADELVALIQQTRSGIFSDKGLQVIEMASKRIREMGNETKKSLDAIGLDSKKISEDLASGAISTFDVIKQVSQAISQLPADSQEVGDALKDVFGRQGAGAGLELIKSLQDIDTSLENAKETTGEYGESLEKLRQANEDLNDAVSDMFDVTQNGWEETWNLLKADVIQALADAIRGIKKYFSDLYRESTIFRTAISVIQFQWKTTWDTIVLLFKGAVNNFVLGAQIIKSALSLDWDGIKSAWKEGLSKQLSLFEDFSNKVKKTAKETADAIANVNGEVKGGIKIGTRKRIGNWICEWNGSKWVGVERWKPTPTTTTTTTSLGGGSGRTGRSGDTPEQRAEKQYKATLELTRKAEDAQTELIEDEMEKRRQKTTLQYNRQIEDYQHRLATEKTLTKEQQASITQIIIDLGKRRDAELAKIDDDARVKQLEAEKTAIDNRLKIATKGSEQELKLQMQLLDKEKEIAIAKNQKLPAEQQQKEADIIAFYDAKKLKAQQDYADAVVAEQLRIFDEGQKLSQSEFDLLKTTEGKKTRFRLMAERDRLKKLLELNAIAGKKMSDAEVQTIKNTIARIDAEIGESEKDEKTKDIWGLLGIEMTDDKKQAVNQAYQFASQQLNDYMQLRTEMAQKAVEASQREVEATQNRLNMEMQARANGYANNVELAQKELENAKRNQEKALREQEKAQKQQQAIQAIEQIGNLVTSTSLIWKQLGFPWAIPAIATMWGSFAYAKIKASQLVKANTEKYADGTIEMLEGGSHQSGNDIDLGTKADGTRRRAEGGEFFAVINKRNSRRFRQYIPDVINSLNNGTFADKYINAYQGTEDALKLNVIGQNPDLTALSEDVHGILEEAQRKSYTDANGNQVITYKNIRRVIR